MNDHKCVKAIGDKGAKLWFHLVRGSDPGLVRAIQRHYPGSKATPGGRCLCWQIVENDRTIGYIGLGDAMPHLQARRKLGLKSSLAMKHSVCVFMYQLVDRSKRVSEASTILAKWHGIASWCWLIRYNWRPVHWETFVNPLLIRERDNPGACFKRVGYRTIGMTSGTTHCYSKHRTPEQNASKIILYKGPLARISTNRLTHRLQLEKDIRRLCAVG